MGVRILYDADVDIAALYCSTDGVAFGPVFEQGDDGTSADERAQAFLDWLGRDPRLYAPERLDVLHAAWERKQQEVGA